jgi:hypothetical protein
MEKIRKLKRLLSDIRIHTMGEGQEHQPKKRTVEAWGSVGGELGFKLVFSFVLFSSLIF